MAGPFDLTGQNIENTYQRILQTPDGATFYDGTGSLITLPSADVSGLVTTSSFNAFTSSINNFTASYNTGSFSGSFTGSLNGTASYYKETDPIFTTKSASLATTGSNIFIGDQTISGSLLVYNTVTNNNSLDTLNRNLIASNGVGSVSWGDRVLTGNDGYEALKWGDTRELIDNSRKTSVDWEGRVLYHTDGTTPAITWIDNDETYTSEIILGGNSFQLNNTTGTIELNAANGTLITGQTTIVGDLIPGDPITNNTSSWSLGSPTAAWKDLYVSNGSVYFISGSISASISFTNGAIDFGTVPVIIPTGSTIPYNSTSSFLGNGISSSFNVNHGFNTRNLHITVYDSASGDIVYPDLKHLNVNTSSVTFANPPSLNQYVVYISQ